MSRTFSIYLDAVRFIAAIAVFLTHLSTENILRINLVSQFGHDAVVVFFVLSGCVIAYTVESRDRDLKTYAISRLARLWSVVIPALCLTLVLDPLGGAFTREASGSLDHSFLTILANALFINQLWFLNLVPGSNSPFWSLGFEVWYYALFAAFTFFSGIRRIFGIAVIALIAGPKILIMLPIWLLGVAVYRWCPRWGELAGWTIFIGSVVLYLVYRWANFTPVAIRISDFLHVEHAKFGMAYYFSSDYAVGVLVALNFWGFRACEHRVAPLFDQLKVSIRVLAGFTFSLYLFHVPIIDYLGRLLGKGNYLIPVIAMVAIFALGAITERKKDAFRRILVQATEHAHQLFAKASALTLRT